MQCPLTSCEIRAVGCKTAKSSGDTKLTIDSETEAAGLVTKRLTTDMAFTWKENKAYATSLNARLPTSAEIQTALQKNKDPNATPDIT